MSSFSQRLLQNPFGLARRLVEIEVVNEAKLRIAAHGGFGEETDIVAWQRYLEKMYRQSFETPAFAADMPTPSAYRLNMPIFLIIIGRFTAILLRQQIKEGFI